MMSEQHHSCGPVVLVHGGARQISDDRVPRMNDGVKRAAIASYKVLQNGGTCVDAVVKAVATLEDDPEFNAGRGSVLNIAGETETHAMVMRGDSCAVGGVCCLQAMKNPVEVARLAMDKSNHCLLNGPASLRLARSHQFQEQPPEYFVSDRTKKRAESYQEKLKTWEKAVKTQETHDTVGAVALDCFGNLACATSTGGFDGQEPGRISDSPVVGAGGYADNQSAAVSTTGHGESILKVALARMVSMYVEAGYSPDEASKKAVEHMRSRVNGFGGVIAVDTKGRVGIHYTTANMSWAQIGGEGEGSNPSRVKYGCSLADVSIDML